MPRPSDYTPARQQMLQVVMAFLLAGTIGLAALVGSVSRRMSHVELSAEPARWGDIGFSLPSAWQKLEDREDARTIGSAVEEGSSPGRSRRVKVLVESLSAPMSPTQYLIERFRLPVHRTSEDAAAHVEAATVAGYPGVMVSLDSLRIANDATARLPQKDVYAAVVLPSRRAVVVHLRGIGRSDKTDERVARQVAEAITIEDEPAVATASNATVTLRAGTTFTPPAGLLPVEAVDPLRTDKLLWPALDREGTIGQLESSWLTAEVLECLFTAPPGLRPEDQEAAAAAFETLLLSRSPGWREARITRVATNVWCAEPRALPSEGSVRSPQRMYLLADPDGRALLAEFRGGYGAGSGIDRAWQQLAASVKFGAAPQVRSMEARGAAIASRMAEIGYEKLVADRTEQWWLWTDAGDRPHRGWTRIDFDVAGGTGELRGTTSSRLRQGNEVRRIDGHFRRSDAAADYHREITRGEIPHLEIPAVEQVTTLRDGRISVAWGPPTRSAPLWEAPMPQQFVPGAVLPLVMDQFTAQSSPGSEALVRSEGFMGVEAVGAPQLVSILIRPVNTDRVAEGETEPMRCVEAEVNGSGILSRWYFRSRGPVERVDLPGGVQLTPSDSNTVKFAFSGDIRMAAP